MATRCCGCMKLKEKAPYCEHCGWDERRKNESHQLPIGTVLENRYVIGRVLGQGGFGITYIGWDTVLDIPIAIKEFFPSGQVMRESVTSTEVTVYKDSIDEQFRENRNRFLREAKSLAKLINIPQIVHIFNFFQANNTAYIVMEYVEGVNLRSYVQQKGKLSQEETMALLGPVLIGLEQVHRAGVIHRDISPDNIMLLPNGGAKLLDFGAVRDVTGAAPGTDATKSTAAILKQGYAPIEQYRDKGDLGPWTDVYALCATICYCLSGEVPPDAPERMMTLVSGEDDGLHFDKIAPGNPSLQKALQHGMAHLAVNRTRTIAQLVEEMTPEETKAERALREQIERETRARAEQERLARQAKERAERERAEQERREREAREKAEAERREREARERAERERLAQEAREKAERERREREAREKAEAERKERMIREKAEAQRKAKEAREKAEAERKARLAQEKAEADRKAKEKAEAQRRAKEEKDRAEAERRACLAQEKAEAQRRAKEKAAAREASREKPKTKGKKGILALAAVAIVIAVAAALFMLPGDPMERDYRSAVELMKSGEYSEAIEAFEALGDYEDSAARLESCRELLQEEQYNSALALFNSGDYTGAADAFAALGGYRDSQEQAVIALKEKGYAEAEALADAGEYAKAGITFAKLGDYRDAKDRSFVSWHKTYRRTTFVSDYNMIDHQDYAVAIKNDGTVHFTGVNPSPKLKYEVPNWTDIIELYGGGSTVLGLRSDGTVVLAGSMYSFPNVSSWTDIVLLNGDYGIRSDGTVVHSGYTYMINNGKTYLEEPPEVLEWTDIVSLDSYRVNGWNVFVGLKTDGTVVVTGDKSEVFAAATQWKEVVSVHIEECYTETGVACSVVGITSDGAVLTAGTVYQEDIGKDLRGVVWMEHNIVLFDDGTVKVFDPLFDDWHWDIKKQEAAIDGWNNVERIYFLGWHNTGADIIGLCKDGTVKVSEIGRGGGWLSEQEYSTLTAWTDIAEIYPGDWNGYTVGLRSDGQMLVADQNTTKIREWTDVRLP